MRPLFILLTGLILTQATVSRANDEDLDLDMDEAEYAASFEAQDVAKAPGWNRWTCTAKRALVIRMYRGSSFYFRAQSGEGQEAKLVAQKIAVRACEFGSGGTCTSNLSECTVERF